VTSIVPFHATHPPRMACVHAVTLLGLLLGSTIFGAFSLESDNRQGGIHVVASTDGLAMKSLFRKESATHSDTESDDPKPAKEGDKKEEEEEEDKKDSKDNKKAKDKDKKKKKDEKDVEEDKRDVKKDSRKDGKDPKKDKKTSKADTVEDAMAEGGKADTVEDAMAEGGMPCNVQELLKQVEGAHAPACLEGKSLEEGHWCTPNCKNGALPFINVTNVLPNWLCADKSQGIQKGTWGAKLCCSRGQLHPAIFTCVPDLFSKIDADKSSSVSRKEFEDYNPIGLNGELDEALEAASAEVDEDPFEDARASKVLKREMVIFGLVFAIAILIAVVFAVQRAAAKAQRKPTNRTKDADPKTWGSERDHPRIAATEQPFLGVIAIEYADLNGTYTKLKDQLNGRPVWSKQIESKTTYIYADENGAWAVGSETAYTGGCLPTIVADSSCVGIFPNGVGLGRWLAHTGSRYKKDLQMNIVVRNSPGQP